MVQDFKNFGIFKSINHCIMNPRRDFIKQMSLASAAIIATPSFANTNFFASDIKHALEDTLIPNTVDIVTALHACDTATDDAIAWSVNADVKLALIAPCCHHDIQAQMNEIPEPWSLLTRNGIMKERLGDLLTDALRMQIMKLRGYRVEAIEFVGGEHTPRNLMIRAVKTGAIADAGDEAKYEQMLTLWKVKPALATLLNR